MTEKTAGTPRFSFETNCPDGQKCAAITTGCLVGQCQRRSSIPCKHSPQPMLPGQVITGYASLYECPWCKIEALEREVAALITQRDEANTRFEDHTKAVAEWTSTAAEIIGLGEHGKVTPDQILDQLIYGRQWASDMQTKLTAAEAELDAAKRALAEMRLVVIKECECYLHSSGTGSICGLHKCDKNAALAAKSTEQKGS